MRKRKLHPVVVMAVVILVAARAGVVHAQQAIEYRGTLAPKLVAHIPPWYVLSRLRLASDEERGRVKIDLATDDRVSVTDVSALVKGPDLKAVLIERASGQFAVLVDLDSDGTWTGNEAARLVPNKDAEDPGTLVAAFDVPLPAGYAYASYPLLMMVSREERPGQPNARTMLLQSSGVAAQGLVDVAGQKALVRYTGVSLKTGVVDPTSRVVEADCNGDGTIDTSWDSPEMSRAAGTPVVFRVGSRYVSTVRVDTASGSIVLRAHPDSDYQRIELQVGRSVPDFAFVDFDGKPRKLSDFRDKYLMLNFWGSWCGPCIARFPVLKEVYAKYHARGFEILGMDKENWEGDQVAPAIEKAKAVISEKAVPWPQTRPDTVKTVIDRFQIVPYPTYVLLDRQGKIVSWGRKGQLPLDGPELVSTLEKLLPK